MEEPLQGLCDAFAARLSDYDTALVSERRSRYTAELARLDGQRDYVFRSFTAQLFFRLRSGKGSRGAAGFGRQVWA